MTKLTEGTMRRNTKPASSGGGFGARPAAPAPMMPAAPINPMRLASIAAMNEIHRRSGGGNGTPAITVNELAWLLDQLGEPKS